MKNLSSKGKILKNPSCPWFISLLFVSICFSFTSSLLERRGFLHCMKDFMSIMMEYNLQNIEYEKITDISSLQNSTPSLVIFCARFYVLRHFATMKDMLDCDTLFLLAEQYSHLRNVSKMRQVLCRLLFITTAKYHEYRLLRKAISLIQMVVITSTVGC